MLSKKNTLLLLVALLFILSGCGGSDGNKNTTFSGVLIDSKIVGMDYECGDIKDVTDSNGKFHCDTMPVIFKIGSYTVGSISQMTDDSKVFPQDLQCVERNNITDSNLIELVQFLQALDDDGDISKAITITNEMKKAFSDINGYNPTLCGGSGSSDGSSNPGGSDNSSNPQPITPSEAGKKAKLPQKDPLTAMEHLRKTISPTDFNHADTSDMSPYVGAWQGGGWGYEVRFKHKSGEFVSSLADYVSEDLDTSKLPFDQEKIIMSLMVTHQTVFKFYVDESGNIEGSGLITYNLLPNLCGLNSLVNITNSTVGSFDKLFSLSSLMGGFAAREKLQSGVKFDANIAKLLYQNTNNAAGFINQDWRSLMADYAKKEFISTVQSNQICSVVAPNDKIKGGLSVGPLSLDELLKDASINVIKTLSSSMKKPKDVVAAAGSMLLSVPGLTQVQYEYKGLINGPETRHFYMSGHIDKNGQIFLNMDSLVEGSEDLMLEYTVNYQTERPTFPIWSPFLDNGGTIYPGDRDFVIYNYENETKNVEYTAYDVLGNSKKETIAVTTPTVKAKTQFSKLPIAIFKEIGTHRNNKSMWHEYEYSWNAYKEE
jgi:hypothetical protein